MADKATEFFLKIGFNEIVDDDSDDDFDMITADGRKLRGPDCLYVETLNEEKRVDLRNEGKEVEEFWERGWISDYYRFRRANFDIYNDRYYKSFPTRYNIREFKFTKSLRRVLNKNRDLKTVIRPLRITQAKSDLHDAYNYLRHGELPETTLQKNYDVIKYYPTKLTELCIFKGEKLIACSIFEIGNYAVYSNTAFWDLNEKQRSLGTLTIILEVQYALKLGMFHYYLGTLTPRNPNYLYKLRYQGLELFDWDYERWRDINDPRTKEMLKQKLPRKRD